MLCVRLDDLVGINLSIAIYNLNIDPSTPFLQQESEHFRPEMDKIIQKEVEKLLVAGHIREIQLSEWLSNIVLMPKARNKWRMSWILEM